MPRREGNNVMKNDAVTKLSRELLYYLNRPDESFYKNENRYKSYKVLGEKFSELYNISPKTFMQWMVYLSDDSRCMDEEIFRRVMNNVDDCIGVEDALLYEVIREVSAKNGWKKIIQLANFGTDLGKKVISIIEHQLKKDLEDPTNASRLAEDMPSVNATSADTRIEAGNLKFYLGLSEEEYRKTMSTIRKGRNMLERLMSENRWSEIDYSKLTRNQLIYYTEAFQKNDKERYIKYWNENEMRLSHLGYEGAAKQLNELAYAAKSINKGTTKILYPAAIWYEPEINVNISSKSAHAFFSGLNAMRTLLAAQTKDIKPRLFVHNGISSAEYIKASTYYKSLNCMTFNTIPIYKFTGLSIRDYITTCIRDILITYESNRKSADFSKMLMMVKGTAELSDEVRDILNQEPLLDAFEEDFRKIHRNKPSSLIVWYITEDEDQSFVMIETDEGKIFHRYTDELAIPMFTGTLSADTFVKSILEIEE